jgi:hypothetical protein
VIQRLFKPVRRRSFFMLAGCLTAKQPMQLNIKIDGLAQWRAPFRLVIRTRQGGIGLAEIGKSDRQNQFVLVRFAPPPGT